MAKLSTLQVTDWSNQSHFGLGQQMSVVGTNLVITPTSSYYSAWSSTTWDLSGSELVAHLITPPNVSNGSVNTNLGVYANSTSDAFIGWEDNQLRVGVQVGGTYTYHGFVTYNPTDHQYLRIRETSGTLYFEAGPTATSFPTLVHSVATPWSVTAVNPYLNGGNWNSSTNPGTATWGMVNATAPVEPPPGGPRSGGAAFIKQADGSWKSCTFRLLPYTAITPQGWQEITINRDPSVRSYAYRSIDYGAGPHYANKPYKVEVGDLLVYMILLDSGTLPAATTLYSGTGFTERHRAVSSGVRFSLATKVAVASDTTNGTYTVGGVGSGPDGCNIVFAIRDWSGSTTNIRSAVTSTTNATWVTPSVTPVTSRSLLMSFISNNGNDGGKIWGYVPPVGAGAAGYTENTGGWNGGAASTELYTGTAATDTRTWKVNTNSTNTLRMGATIAIPAGTTTTTAVQLLAGYEQTGGTGGPKTDTTANTFTDSTGLSSTYHLFADGLDWSKKVGLLVYTDGSGESGLAPAAITNQTTYVLYGPDGMIAAAKRQNMILLTPRAPGDGCRDGDGVCWYDHSLNGVTPWQKLEWSNELIRWILTRYDINRTRIAIGGYSSGAQWTMSWWGPRYGADVMLDGVAVGISYGGEPRVNPNLTAAYKAAVEHVWDTGDTDTAYTQPMWWNGVQTGRQWYQDNGFAKTDLVLVSGGHEGPHRSGQFGTIMEREIIARVPPA